MWSFEARQRMLDAADTTKQHVIYEARRVGALATKMRSDIVASRDWMHRLEITETNLPKLEELFNHEKRLMFIDTAIGWASMGILALSFHLQPDSIPRTILALGTSCTAVIGLGLGMLRGANYSEAKMLYEEIETQPELHYLPVQSMLQYGKNELGLFQRN